MDVLTLGGITFDAYSTPSSIGAGGKQSMVVHKLPGGNRVVDTLGPDEDNITWKGEFFGSDSVSNALTLDGMRKAGSVISLTFAGTFRSVIIDSFHWHVRRYPAWVEYDISCLVYQDPSQGSLGGSLSDIGSLIIGDFSFAAGLVG